jgi:hypothetical protein
MNEIMFDLVACQDLVNSIDAEMQLIHMAIEQIDKPFTLQVRERVYLLLDYFQFSVSSELYQLQIKMQRATDVLVNIERGSQL